MRDQMNATALAIVKPPERLGQSVAMPFDPRPQTAIAPGTYLGKVPPQGSRQRRHDDAVTRQAMHENDPIGGRLWAISIHGLQLHGAIDRHCSAVLHCDQGNPHPVNRTARFAV
jgi:hypothetical protein